PDKQTNACVYLWTRDPKLCGAPRMAGAALNTDLTTGQLIFPRGSRCTVYGHPVRWDVAASISRVTQDPQPAFTAAYARAVASSYAHVTSKAVLDAEKALIGLHFHGSRGAYVAAVQHDRATVAIARGVIADELPLAKAPKPIVTALVSLARDTAYQNWLLEREKDAQAQTLCWRDQLPAVEVVPLTDYLSYLALDSGAAASTTTVGGPRGE